jgi:hypothetical protein
MQVGPSLLKDEHAQHGAREEVIAEMSQQYADSDPYYIKYWKMINYAIQTDIFVKDLADFDGKIPKKMFSRMIVDFDYRIPRGEAYVDGEVRAKGSKMAGKQLTKRELRLLVLLTAGSSFIDNITSNMLEKVANRSLAEVEAELETFEAELAADASRRKGEERAQREAKKEAARRREVEGGLFEGISHQRKELGNLAKILLKTRMLPTSCSVTAETSDTGEDIECGKYLATIRRDLRLVPLRTRFLSQWENICEEHDDANANKECHLGDGDRGLCDALARCMWGDEVYSGFLNFKVNQELQDNVDWYAKKVGLASAHIGAGTGTKMTTENDHVLVEFAAKGVSDALTFLDDEVPMGPGDNRHMCFVHVFVEKVTGLELPAGASHIAPFVAVSLGEHGTSQYQSYRTVTQKNTLEPEYNSYCTFEVEKYQDLMQLNLAVRVSDDDYLQRGAAQPLMGAAHISLFQYAKPGSHFKIKPGLEESSVMGRVFGSLAAAGEGYEAEMDAQVHLDIYVGCDVEAEKTSLRMLAAANVIKRPVFSVAIEADKEKHGLGYFAALGLFPPLRDITPDNYNQSPLAVGWRDEEHSILVPMARSSAKHLVRPKCSTHPQADDLDWEIEDDIECGGKMSTGASEGASWMKVMLCVQIMSARNLAAADKNGFSDPQLKLTVGKHTLQHHTTKICKKTLDPLWMETVCFEVLPGKQQIKIVVKDDDGGIGSLIRLGSDKLGESVFALDCRVENPQFSGGKVLHQWITLKKGSTTKHQEVEMKFMLSPHKGFKEWDPFFGKEQNMLKYAEANIYRDSEPSTVMPYVTNKIQQVVRDMASGVLTERQVLEKADELVPSSMLDEESIAKQKRKEAKEARKKEQEQDEAMLQQIAEMPEREEDARKQLAGEAKLKNSDLASDARSQEKTKNRTAEEREDDRINAIEDPEEREAAKKKRIAINRSKFAVSKPTTSHRGKLAKQGSNYRQEQQKRLCYLATQLQAIERGRISRETTAQKQAAGTLPAQVAAKKHVAKFVEFMVFTYEDPTGSLPEDVVLKIDTSGIRLHSLGSQESILAWKWSKVKGVRVDEPEPEEDGSVSEAEQTDLVHIKVDSLKFCFEAEDGAEIKEAATTWRTEAKRKKKERKKP